MIFCNKSNFCLPCSYTLPYEIINGKERCIADEVPFEIPDSWEWVRISQAALSIVDCPHSTPKYYDYETEYCAIDTNCINESGEITGFRYVDEEAYSKRIERLEPKENDIVYTREGTIGRAAILPPNKRICLGQRVMLIRCTENLSVNYLKKILMAPQTISTLTAKQRGLGAKHVNVSDVCNLIIPLPPLAEQKRIVSKIEELTKYCDKL
jgi:type I restriction enzyme S subunit